MEIIIESERLVLRPWKLEDAEASKRGLDDYDVAKNLTVPFPYTIENARAYIKKTIDKPNTLKSMRFAITLKGSGEVIGGTSIDVNDENVATGGIWLNKNFHGKGFGTEAMRARAKFCFEVLKVDYLDNGFLEGNEASWHMQEKIGYKKTGEIADNNCPARGGKTKEIKTKLVESDFVKE